MAGVAGGILAFVLGWLVYGIALNSVFDSMAGSATGVERAEDEMCYLALFFGHIAWGFLFAVIFGRWANISTFATGAKAGALLGFLIAATYDLIGYGTSNLSSFTGVLLNIAVMVVLSAIIGGFVAWLLGRGKS